MSTKQVTYGKSTREISLAKASKWYPTDPDAQPKKVGFSSMMNSGVNWLGNGRLADGWTWSKNIGRVEKSGLEDMSYTVYLPSNFQIPPKSSKKDSCFNKYLCTNIFVCPQTRKTIRPSSLRPSLTPGTVLIILAGRFRGKRVVYLKPLTNGVLLVTGPFKINGVPLRRVNSRYVIATSTKVDLAGVEVDKFDDKYFAREKEAKKSTEEKLFTKGDKIEKKETPQVRKDDQKAVDAALLKNIKSTPHLAAYIASSFSLSKGDRPHLMKF
ncbi:ribosomal protein L6e-domain-containing protein [Geopyxis carbonaria]|nr:ribosomal protein L6e-domain-containing protein [Geopyxis carbonaria]